MNSKITLGLLLCCFAISKDLRAENPDPWPNRLNALKAAQVLQRELAGLDRELHAANAPKHVTDEHHHLEESVIKFVTLVEGNCTYSQASSQFHHIHIDLHNLSDELYQHPQLLRIPKLAEEWRHTQVAYNSLDLEMYHHILGRWTEEAARRIREKAKALEIHP